MDSTFISNKSCYIHKYLCFTRCISGTNLQILQFTPIMRYQGRFTTSLPRVSPCINTSLCKHVCMWWGHHLYQPVLNIHSFSLNKEINQHYRCNTFLFLSVCSVLPLPASQLGVWVARGQERGEVLCSQPMPCSIASTSHVGPLPWGTPRRTEWGRWHATHGPLLSVPAPFWGGFYSSWPRGIPGWWSPAVPPRVSLTPSHAIGSCPWCPSHVGMTNHPGTCTSLGVPRMMYSARLCTGAGAKPWQPQQAAGQHIFVLRSERLWQPCPNNPIGQKCKQLHAQEVFLKMPFISGRGKIWDLGCGELTCWPFILRGHRCLKTARFLNEITLGGPGLLRRDIFCCAENKGMRVHRHKHWIQSLCEAREGALGQNRGALTSLHQPKEMTKYLWVILVLTEIVMYGSIDLM